MLLSVGFIAGCVPEHPNPGHRAQGAQSRDPSVGQRTDGVNPPGAGLLPTRYPWIHFLW